MAISEQENFNNTTRMQAISKRVSRQIALVSLYEAAKMVEHGYEIDIPAEMITAIKIEFATLRTEVETLEDNITG
jgi:hypothetical protein